MGSNRFRSPSLNSLHVFEASARHLSFTRAAGELHVTQAAVSRHIRQLETELGKPLFVRLHRRVELTAAGRRLADDLTRSFDAIAHSLETVRSKDRQTIRLSVEPGFAARWLLPRVPRFLATHGDIDVDIESSDLIREVGRETDMAIRYIDGLHHQANRNESLLTEVSAFPVLAPSLSSSGSPLRQPGDLLQFPLLHEDDGRYWQRWFELAGASVIETPHRMRLNDLSLVLQAAGEGLGVALADELLARDDLGRQRLFRPFDIGLKCGAYWLVSHPTRVTSGQRAFGDWLHQELAAEISADAQ